MAHQPLADFRKDYEAGSLQEAHMPTDPWPLLRLWIQTAMESGVEEPTAMTLATVSAAGVPSARVVLLKDLDARGLTFYTNLQSQKSQDLQANPRAALCLWWPPLERQVRIQGAVELVESATADAYFASRPRASQIGAWTSPQSQPIADRATLQDRMTELETLHAGAEVPRPPHWGGWRLLPDTIEFWQGRPSRLHDRIRYQRADQLWLRERLAP